MFRLVTDSPVEERIISRATDKLNMTGLVVEAGKFNRDSKAAERRSLRVGRGGDGGGKEGREGGGGR